MRKIYKNVIFIHLLLRLLAVDKLMSTESEVRGGKIWGIVWAAGLIVDSSLLKPPSGWPLSYEKIWDEYIECCGIEGKCVARTMIIFLLLLIQFGIFIDVLWSELQMKLCGFLLIFIFVLIELMKPKVWIVWGWVVYADTLKMICGWIGPFLVKSIEKDTLELNSITHNLLPL